MSDDVALNFRRACFNGVAARAQVTVSPHAVVDCVVVPGLELSVGSQQFLGDLLEALVQLAPEDFLDRAFRSGHAGGADTAESAHLVAAHDLDLGVALCQLLADKRIFRGRTAIALGYP